MMKNYSFMFFLILFSATNCTEENIIKPKPLTPQNFVINGKVNLKNDSSVVSNLEIILSGKQIYIDSTDTFGKFVFENLAEGEYKLSIQSSDFNELDTSLTILRDTTIILEIEKAVIFFSPIKWLKDYSIEMNSVDPAYEDYSDLQNLKSILANKKIVMLGEQTHGDGTTFLTKTRLIKFLHKEMNFKVLAFESGLCDCKKINELLKSGSDPYETMKEGIHSVWTGSEQFQPLIKFVGESIGQLEICGFDNQLTGTISMDYLPNDLEKFLENLNINPFEIPNWEDVKELTKKFAETYYFYNETPDSIKTMYFESLDLLSSLINDSHEDESNKEVGFWLQWIKSHKVNAYYIWSFDVDNLEFPKEYQSMRDEQMANNLIWLSEKYYPDEKIIVWAASIHNSRNTAKNLSAYTINFMGHHVYETFGNQMYSLGFIAYEGEYFSFSRRSNHEISPAPGHSFEYLLYSAGFNNAIIDFTGNYEMKDWLQGKRVARPFGYSSQTANWTLVFDGFVFNKTMHPSIWEN
ncbi:MAG: erythromycin esterase family protein [Ignavibacteriae bacterium]|nr:erythromycin esterase family protein [Ignavibacteriota bacterium]